MARTETCEHEGGQVTARCPRTQPERQSSNLTRTVNGQEKCTRKLGSGSKGTREEDMARRGREPGWRCELDRTGQGGREREWRSGSFSHSNGLEGETKMTIILLHKLLTFKCRVCGPLLD